MIKNTYDTPCLLLTFRITYDRILLDLIKKGKLMLSEKTAMKIIHESNHGGVQNYHPEISMRERKALLNYILRDGKCLPNCAYCAQV